VEFAIARTYELDQDWPDAIAGYKGWLDHFPTNQSRARTLYSLARVNSQAGNESDAFGLFTNLVMEFPTSDLAPQAQWWVADYFFSLGGTNSAYYVDAERNYKMLFQNTNWQGSPLVDRARMMAGRAAVARQDYSGAIRDYFITLESDTNCPPDLREQAIFAHGSALMFMDSTETNYPLANFKLAKDVFSQLSPTNELGVLAMIEIGKCYLQLTNYDAATNSYAQVVNATNASVSARSQAQIGIGIVLEKMAAALTGTNQTAAWEEARDNYLEVFDTWTGKNLRAGETADRLWVMKAGKQALPLIGKLGTGNPDKFINQMEDLFPQSKDSLEKIRAALPPPDKN
jgi:tetratricopeptide (TPR) repeat protein